MKIHLLPVIVFSLALAACAQDPGSAPHASQDNGGGYGQRGGRGFGGVMGVGGGRGGYGDGD